MCPIWLIPSVYFDMQKKGAQVEQGTFKKRIKYCITIKKGTTQKSIKLIYKLLTLKFNEI